MRVKAEPFKDPVHANGRWITGARVTVRITDAEYEATDGLRYEVPLSSGHYLKTVKAEPLGEPVHENGAWTIRAMVIVRMTDAEYEAAGSLRIEVFPWSRFRVKVRQGTKPGTWCYEVRDLESDCDEPVILRRGERPSWDLAATRGHEVIRDLRRSMLGKETPL